MSYTKKDYESNDGMLTYIWGPPLWHFLHTMSFNYPVNPTEEDKDKYYNFLLSLGEILPCKYCRDNFTNNLKSIKFNETDFNSRENFSRMIYDLHNEVNHVLKKDSNSEFNDIQWKYEHFRARCNLDDLRKSKKGDGENGCVEPYNKKIPKHKCKLEIIPLTKENTNDDNICFDKCILKK